MCTSSREFVALSDGHNDPWWQYRGLKCLVASDFAKVAASACPNMNILYVPAVDIANNISDLDAHWEDVRHVLRTRRVHAIKVTGAYSVQVAKESFSENYVEHEFK